ncbi:MAG TPA: M20/M25/M40 family metallo-hydrolase, partial [Longimicrobiales bacterium]
MKRTLPRAPHALAATLLLALATAGTAAAQSFPSDDPVIKGIWSEGMEHSQLYRLGQSLMDSIGPRLNGTPAQRAGNDWLVKTYAGWGISARNEQYGTWKGWREGVLHVDLLQPRVHTLEAHLLGWSPGTNGPVQGEVVVFPDVKTPAELEAWLPQVRGKYVLVSFAQPSCRPDSDWIGSALPAEWTKFRVERAAADSAWTRRLSNAGVTARDLAPKLDAAGARGVLSNRWSQGWGVDKVFNAHAAHVPEIDLSCEDYGLVFRLAQNNQHPLVRVDAQAQLLGDVPVFNTIAEIKGTEKPNEYVILSAHFDSWHAGTGATDNGTGTITMMEAARILKQVYPNPKRTILVGHWASEEQGLNGSAAFVEDHPEIVKNLQALFNQDNGTGRVVNISAS